MRPKLFIASSSESIDFASSLKKMLEQDIEVTVWDKIFEPSNYILEDLLEKMSGFQFGAFVFSPDDLIIKRDNEHHITRDNVIFELGLFIGKLGRKNCFIVVCKNGKELLIPTDLLGVNYITFNSEGQEDKSNTPLVQVKDQILNAIRKSYGKRKDIDETKVLSIIKSEGELFEQYRLLLLSSIKEIIFVVNKREWIFPLMISLFSSQKRGLVIWVIYYYSDNKEKESFRLKLLQEIGCNVIFKHISEKPSFLGVISNFNSKDYSKLIIQPNSDVNEVNFARKYSGIHEYEIVEMAYNSVKDLLKSDKKSDFTPRIEEVSLDQLIEKIKTVPFYKNCTFSLEKVEVKKIIPLTRSIRSFKLNQISTLIDFYKEINLELFKPCAITTVNNNVQLLVPPVLEEFEGNLYIAEGHTRSFYCIHNNIKEFYALIVKGCSYPLAASPNNWNNVEISYYEAKTHAINEGRNIAYARRIEAYTHWINI